MLTNPNDIAVSITVRAAGSHQACFRLTPAAWQALGQPQRVDIKPRLDQGFDIAPGDAIALRHEGQRYEAAISAAKVGLSGHVRGAVTVKVTTQAIPRALVLSAPPAEWIGARPVAPSPPPPAPAAAAPPQPAPPAGRVLPDLAGQPAPIVEVTGRVGVTFRATGMGGFQVALTVPLVLLGEIGDPERVVVIGNAHEGYAIRKVLQGGVKVSYASQSNAYVVKGSKDENLTREPRAMMWVAARAQGGAIRVVPLPSDWVLGRNGTLAPVAAPPRADGGPKEARLPANPATAPLPRLAPSDYAITATSSLRRQYDEARVRLLDLKRALETQMNSKLKFGPGLRLVVAED